jgi:Zn-dependent M28 family amino/carboxypeptidase
VSGSEAGLLGSTWFVEHPTIALDEAVAVLDLDMIGRNHPDIIGVVGSDAAGLRSLMRRLAMETPELRLEVVSDPPGTADLRPGDHSIFADRGIPAARITAGLHADHHTPADEPDTVDADKIARVARLVFLTVHQLAAGEDPPS